MERFKLRAEKGERLIDAVARGAGSKKRAKRLIDEGLVSVNYKKELSYRRPMKGGEVVIFPLPENLFKRPEVELLAQKEKVWVFNKPPFITSNEGKGSLEELIRKEFNPKLKVAHRLDKQTSGAILAVEDGKTFEKLKEIFKRREVEKEYLALVKGELQGKRVIKTPLDGREAITIVEPVERFRGATLIRAKIETGRKHQIRRHLAQIGHPIVGEFEYYRGGWKEELLYAPRILLHAKRVALKTPEGGKLEVEAELPEDFREFLEGLRR